MARRRGASGPPTSARPDPRLREAGAERRSLEPGAVRASARSERGGEESSRHTSESGRGGLYGSDVAGNLPRASLAELIGTFILVLAGTAVATAATLKQPIAGSPLDSLAVALAFGLALAAIVAAMGHVSGAHVNPAVTLGLAATGKFPWKGVPAYLAAQLGGALLAALSVWVVFGSKAQSQAKLGATYPTDAATIGQALLVEAIITFVLVYIVLAVATDERAPSQAAPLAVGFALFVGVIVGGPISGGSVNPARSLGPMIAAGDLSYFWIYILGPVAGGVIAALLYDRVVSRTEAPG
jgi:MIP family channel proteins